MWSDVLDGVSFIRHSDVESARFGTSIARLTIGTGWPTDFADAGALYSHVAAELEAAKERIVFLRFPSELVRMGEAVAASGRSTVPAGTLMYWSVRVGEFRNPDPSAELIGRRVDRIADHDLAPLVAALEDSFSDYSNHYSANSMLDTGLVVAGYREWAESTIRSARGTAYALESGSATIGVATVSIPAEHPDVCEIELAGVITEQQGAGRYRYLLGAVVDGARADGCKRVVISTQSYNIRVQRAWAAAGFRPVESLDTYHAVSEAGG